MGYWRIAGSPLTAELRAERPLDQPGPERIRRSVPFLPGPLNESPDADPHVLWCGGAGVRPAPPPDLALGGEAKTVRPTAE
jgi:hypothetical protein